MLSSRLTLGSRLTFVGGKGGVGKTTVAAALAVELAGRGERILVLSTDPAHSLGDALGEQLAGEPREVRTVRGLMALEVDADLERRRFMEANGQAIRALIERGTYLDQADVAELTERVLPGLDELSALLAVSRLARTFEGRLIVDTAPTGHTLRLLQLPDLALRWLDALEAMEAKHAAVASALAGSYAGDEATNFLHDFREQLHHLAGVLHDHTSTRFVLVTTAEPVVLAETLRLADELAALRIATGGVVVNRHTPPAGVTGIDGEMVYVPLLEGDLVGIAALERFAASGVGSPSQPEARATRGTLLRVGARFIPRPGRRMYWVGGKGGVGKTTVAASLAILLADRRAGQVLLLGVDPAGSLGDVLELEVGSNPIPVPGVGGLRVQQLDAGGAWATFRRDYEEEVERVLGELFSGGTSATLDRGVIERVVDLAPPGVDELMALMEVIDLTEDRSYDALVLDTAPTGHLLRLLEMPDLALDWCHTVMRLLLKYRETISLTGVGERILELSRSLRALGAALRDRNHTYFLAVALPESLSVPETARLLPRLDQLGVPADALLVNRVLDRQGRPREEAVPATLRLAAFASGVALAGAPLLPEPPRSVARLREFAAAWRSIDPAPVPSPASGDLR